MCVSYWGIWLICAGVPLLFGLWAQARVKSTFNRYSQVPTHNGMTGNDAAAAVLRASGLDGVSIHPVPGRLTDHYDPRSRTLNLSQDVGLAATVAAVGVAAHEAGHAIQDADHYRPMRIRQTLVPAAQFGQSLWFLPVLIGLVVGATGLVTIGLMVGATGLVTIGLILFSAVVLFQLITLPVEFDASKRALAALESQGLLAATEVDGARAVLSAAALTYVAGFVASLGQLIYFFLLSRR
jgi:Zn-dependent membrane protease YugP